MLKVFKTSALLLAASCSFSVLAEDAQQLLKQQLAQLKTFTANFSQQVVDAEGELLQTSSGKISLAQPNKLHWQVAPPNENTLIADGQTLWHVDPFVEQVVAMRQQDAVANNPMILLTEPDSEHWQQFSVSVEGRKYVIRALSDESHVLSLSLTFEQQQLVKLAMQDRQEQTSTLSFSEIEQNQPLAAELFEFTLPEGFELDDQR